MGVASNIAAFTVLPHTACIFLWHTTPTFLKMLRSFSLNCVTFGALLNPEMQNDSHELDDSNYGGKETEVAMREEKKG
jgi:hypothetical protein